MTRDEFGWLRAIDRLAAVHVMGMSRAGWWYVPPDADLPPDAPSLTVVRALTTDGPNSRRVPYYTQSISDAWTLVEKLKGPPSEGDYWHWTPEIAWVEDEEPAFWEVCFGAAIAEAPTAPLAITLAALKAHGVEIPEEPT